MIFKAKQALLPSRYKHLQTLGDHWLTWPKPVYHLLPCSQDCQRLTWQLCQCCLERSLRFPALFRVELSYFLEHMYGISKDITIVMCAISSKNTSVTITLHLILSDLSHSTHALTQETVIWK